MYHLKMCPTHIASISSQPISSISHHIFFFHITVYKKGGLATQDWDSLLRSQTDCFSPFTIGWEKKRLGYMRLRLLGNIMLWVRAYTLTIKRAECFTPYPLNNIVHSTAQSCYQFGFFLGVSWIFVHKLYGVLEMHTTVYPVKTVLREILKFSKYFSCTKMKLFCQL